MMALKADTKERQQRENGKDENQDSTLGHRDHASAAGPVEDSEFRRTSQLCLPISLSGWREWEGQLEWLAMSRTLPR